MSKIIDLIDSYIERDPAAKGRIEVFFTSPGLHAVGLYRLSNFLWSLKLQFFAKIISSIGSFPEESGSMFNTRSCKCGDSKINLVLVSSSLNL